MRVVVVGLGYVGSVCSACLAERGHTIVGVDTSEFKVACIRRGESPIVEKGLPELIARAVRDRRLEATTRIAEAMPGADIVLVCVGTPSAEDGSLDLSQVKRACAEVGTALKGADRFVTVVMRSTMLPGSVLDELAPVLEQASGGRAGHEFGVAYNPEFLREGAAVEDFFSADYTVVGARARRCGSSTRASVASCS
jgi:GDP-mannose 6-dehydrogenase